MRHFLDLLLSWGPAGVFTIATVESAGIPNPGGTDFLLLALAIARPGEAFKGAALAVIGSLLGSVIFFEILRKGGERYLARYTSSGRGARFRAWFLRYGLLTVFIPALLPIPILPFKAFAACACALGVRRTRFLLLLASARIPRYFALAYLGSVLGETSPAWLKSHLWYMLGIAGLLFLSLYAMIRWSEKKALQ
jgi:uncharacterized membrane protein YdjX (TVP38/TMEM64 family)